MSKKGPAFERKFCTDLSLWWTKGASDDVFWRTAGSGGRATNRRKKGKSAERMCGDICATDPVGEPFLKVFACELKRGYNSFTIQDLVDAPEGAAVQKYHGWIVQAEASRASSGALFWMIVCKRDRRSPLVMTTPYFHLCLQNMGHSWRGAGARLELESPECGGVLMTTLDDFFENVTPEGIHAVLERGLT